MKPHAFTPSPTFTDHPGAYCIHCGVKRDEHPEQTLPLSETAGMLHRLAAAEIAMHGRYLCMVDGVRTEVVA